jgi:peptide subunit release factor 1 (eRF1)
MGNYKYITNRTLEDSSGKPAGNIAIRVPNGSDMADVRYRCPECQNAESKHQEWKRPFSIKCSKCGFLMRITRLKDEIKKDKLKARARA